MYYLFTVIYISYLYINIYRYININILIYGYINIYMENSYNSKPKPNN